MLCSSSLKFNAVSEWWDEYIAYVSIIWVFQFVKGCVWTDEVLDRYDMLKKHVYQLERQQLSMRDTGHDLEANEHTSLMGNHHDITSMDSQFIPLLDRELKKITLFYESQEKELMDDVVELQRLIQQQEDLPLDGRHRYMTSEDGDDDDDDDEEDEFDVQSPTLSRTTHSRSPVRNRRRRSRSESGGVANSGISLPPIPHPSLFNSPAFHSPNRGQTIQGTHDVNNNYQTDATACPPTKNTETSKPVSCPSHPQQQQPQNNTATSPNPNNSVSPFLILEVKARPVVRPSMPLVLWRIVYSRWMGIML